MRYIFILLLGISLSPLSLYAVDTPTKPSLGAKAAASTTASLNDVLNNQKEILKQLAEIKQELIIVKARATR